MKGMQKISRGSGFKGVLSYAFEGKDQEAGHGRLLGGSMAGTTARELAAEFRAIARLRPDIARPVWHNSLRMPAGEDISDARWNAIATSYLKRMRFDVKRTQYAVFKHDDAHVHLVVNRVMTDGSVFLGRNENLLSTKVIQRLERAFKLTLTPGPTYSAEGKIVMPERSKPSKNELEQALRLGELPARLALQARVTAALQGRPTTGEFLARLDAVGVQAVPNIASTGRMNGFSFEWEGIAFTGSQLGAAYKWAAIQQEMEYDQVRDSQELARRQAEARHRRADGAAAKPAGDAASELVSVTAATGEPGPADRGAAAAGGSTGPGDGAAGRDLERDHAAVGVAPGDGREAQSDRVGVAQGQERPAVDAGHRGERGGGRDGRQGGEGEPHASDDSVSAGQRGEAAHAGEPRGLERAQAHRILKQIGQLAVTHDETLKVMAWRQQAAALGASAYRLSLSDGLCPLGTPRPTRFGPGMASVASIEVMAGEGANDYSAGQIEALMPELRALNAKGFDVSFTPLDPVYHYLVVQGLGPQRLDRLRADGYVPALVQRSGEADLQAVLKVPRESDRDDEQSLADAVSLEVTQRWGQRRSEDVDQGLPMAGFIRHGHPEKAKKSALTVILEALGALCMKTLARLRSLRLASDQEAEKVALTQQGALKKGQSAAKFLSGMDAQLYSRHAAQSSGADPDQMDLAVAKSMLKEGHPAVQVTAVLRTSPGLAERYPDGELYVKEAVKNARNALAAPGL